MKLLLILLVLMSTAFAGHVEFELIDGDTQEVIAPEHASDAYTNLQVRLNGGEVKELKYCYKCGWSCALKGNPPVYKCSTECAWGYYTNCPK